VPARVTDTSHSPPPFHHHVVPLVPPCYTLSPLKLPCRRRVLLSLPFERRPCSFRRIAETKHDICLPFLFLTFNSDQRIIVSISRPRTDKIIHAIASRDRPFTEGSKCWGSVGKNRTRYKTFNKSLNNLKKFISRSIQIYFPSKIDSIFSSKNIKTIMYILYLKILDEKISRKINNKI